MNDPHKPDSLAALGKAASGSTRVQRALPWLFSALTLVFGWVASKVDTRLDIQNEVRAQVFDYQRNQDALQAERHAQLLHNIANLERLLIGQDVNNLGRVTLVEKSVWWSFRAISQLYAMSLAGETPKTRAAKQAQGVRFGNSFDARAGGRLPQAVYDEVVAQVAVP